MYLEAIRPGYHYSELDCTQLESASVRFSIRLQLSKFCNLYIKISPRILNLKNSGNMLKEFSTPVGETKCEQLQHSTYRLIICCNIKYEKSETDVSGSLSSRLTLTPSLSPFPDLSKVKKNPVSVVHNSLRIAAKVWSKGRCSVKVCQVPWWEYTH